MKAGSKRTLLAVLAVAATAALTVGTAGAITVYTNEFANKAAYKELQRSGGGKACERSYRQKSKAMRIAVKRGPLTCGVRPPVVGDAELPNHDLGVEGRILKNTPKPARRGAYIELSVRTGGGGVGYILRVFPQRGRFELTRGPAAPGAFPVRGRSDAINGINERNRINLVADGAQVRAYVNREEVARVDDPNPGQVTGRKLRFGAGAQADGRAGVVAVFRRVSVAVPTR